ncbi:hypothetical protein GCM10010123_35200 [Pilimelia anulata]|uniref:Streptogrisin C n=1 Tax=Pilimelia anulata TaxID=53371 RepID=A0A8J3B8K6_9ACTN|nr:S1 family peptidase [Pilimelia anulata]GGK02179.1 hypothetical protein GCM10010123_35200 [Pilimelia anulata]
MTRRLAAIAVAVAVVAGGVLAVPAVADVFRADRTPDPDPVAADPDAPLLRALSRDLALNPDRARSRLAAERRAYATETALRGRLGGRFGGAWLARDTDRLTVAVTDPDRAAAVRAAGATPRLVRHSEAALAAVQARLERRARSAPVAGWYVDVAENTVVVLADGDGTRTRAYLRRAGVDDGAVTVRSAPGRPRLYADRRAGGDGFRGDGGACSIGFAVEGGFVTAGHCGRVGSGARTDGDRPLGSFASTHFPGDDYAFVRTAESVAPGVNDHGGAAVPVLGAREAPVGASVCRSGARTGWRCGTILARNATVKYAEGNVTGLTRTDVCAEPGDSGGSWISDGQAQGITSGGSGDCTDGGVTYFQPLREALSAYGLNLRVADPPPPAPGTGCAGLPVRGPATLRDDAPAYRPNATYYVSRAPGTHRGCVAAPGGAPVTLALERWTGSSWVTAATARGDGTAALRHRGVAGYYRYRAGTDGGPVGATVGYAAPR